MFHYTWCLRYNICSAWFLDIRISTCFYSVTGYDMLASFIAVHVSEETRVLSISHLAYKGYDTFVNHIYLNINHLSEIRNNYRNT